MIGSLSFWACGIPSNPHIMSFEGEALSLKRSFFINHFNSYHLKELTRMPIITLLNFLRGFLMVTVGLLFIGLASYIVCNRLNPGMKALSASDFKNIGTIITIDILITIIVHLNIKRLT